MKIFNQYILFLFILGLSLNSCNSIRVYSDFDSEIDFSNYQSFAFYKTGIDKVEISDIDKNGKVTIKALRPTTVAKN